MKQTASWHQPLVTTFGVLGYLSCVLQWLWAGVLFLPLLLDSEAKNLLLPPEGTSQSISLNLGGDSLLTTAIGIIVTLVVLIVTVIILIRLPLSIAKVGSKITTSTTQAVLPVVTHHKKIPAKKRRLLTVQIIKIVKFCIVLLPAICLTAALFFETPLATELVFMVGSMLAIGSLTWFSLEYITARWLHIPADRIL